MFDDLLCLPASLQKRGVRSILRRFRERAGLTQIEAAAAAAWSFSKLTRIENGVVKAAPGDVRLLTMIYGASDQEQQALAELARLARRKDAFTASSALTSRIAIHDLLDYESAAHSIRAFAPCLIPGLLQTKAYALHLLSGWNIPPERAQHIWEIRAARQEAFWSSPTPVSLDVVLRETAILTEVGGPQVMAQQLDALIQHVEQTRDHHRVHLHVLGTGAGHPPGANRSLMIFGMDSPWLSDIVYREDAHGATTDSREEPELFARDVATFENLRTVAGHAITDFRAREPVPGPNRPVPRRPAGSRAGHMMEG